VADEAPLHLLVKNVPIRICEVALDAGEFARAQELLAIPESLDPGQLTPIPRAGSLRVRARLDAVRGVYDGGDERFTAAARICREFDVPFERAITELQHAEWLVEQGRRDEAEPLLDEARQTFEQLRATPWLQRVFAASAGERLTAAR
jgi:ATP/maltotriose-dependent transcriptional regulator MalT